MAAASLPLPRDGLLRRVSDFLVRRPTLWLLVLLAGPVLWIGIVYVGSLIALLLNAFYSIDEFAGTIVYEPTFKTLLELFHPANLDVLVRTVVLAASVTLVSTIVAYPIAYYAARYAKGRWKALFYIAVMMPLWSSYLVKVYAWKLILAKEGIIGWMAEKTGTTFVLDGILSLPIVGGQSLSVSYLGMGLVFVYMWLPFMILPLQASLERVPTSMIEASADLGATPGKTFRSVIFPLALPGLAAGSIFTFSLTLGDYIIPDIVGPPSLIIGQVVSVQQGTAGNIPLAAAFSIVPILVMAIYLTIARRMGAFDAL